MVNNNNLKYIVSIVITKFDIYSKYDILCVNCIVMEGKIMNLKTDENQVHKTEERKSERKRNFIKSLESLNILLKDKKNQENTI